MADLANSIKSKRWADQVHRLHESYNTIFFLVEGDLREDVGLPYQSLWATCLNASLRKGSTLIRTWNTQESAVVVRQLAQKGLNTPGIPTGLAPPAPLTKRKRDADKKTVFSRQLMIIPSISENVATKLVEHFGDMPALQEALSDTKKYPKINLDEKKSLGKERWKKLASYLL